MAAMTGKKEGNR